MQVFNRENISIAEKILLPTGICKGVHFNYWGNAN